MTEADKQYQLLDVQYKLEVAEKDLSGLTPRVFAHDSANGTLKMEFIEGIPLNKYSGSLSKETMTRFIRDLEKFHSLGLYHGDLSDVAHWILTPEGRIRLIDPSFTYRPAGKTRVTIQQTDIALAIRELEHNWGYKDLTIYQLLKNKYNLHKSEDVEAAAARTLFRTGRKVSQDPLVRIQNYLDRLGNIINPPQLEGHPWFDRKTRNLEMLKRRLYDTFVIKPVDIPESYWEYQRQLIRERGQGGDLERVNWETVKQQNTEAIVADQKSSLDKWIDYIASPDSSWMPDAFKYYVFRSVLGMSEYDGEKGVYPQRSGGTTKPFPNLNREALAYVVGALNKKYKGRQIDFLALEEEDQQQFQKLLQGENFAKLYAWAIKRVTFASPEQLTITSGEWIKYDQGSDHIPLVKSIQGHGTGWCTAGEFTAQGQLQSGDFYVYYTLDREEKPTIPRAAIRMEGNRIAEIRGIAADQNLDGGVVQVVEEKLKEFPDGERYKKRVRDMELLTEIEHKMRQAQSLTRQELVFLYELDSLIEGFGFSRDPRIQELRSQRTLNEDLPSIFECGERQIARSAMEISADTKAFIGSLEPGIFLKIQLYGIEHIYTSFPEGRITRKTVKIGGASPEVLLEKIHKRSEEESKEVEYMIKSSDFITLDHTEEIALVQLKLKDLGFSEKDTVKVDEFFKRGVELGLELCPPEVGPYYLLTYSEKPEKWFDVAMRPILNRWNQPCVFRLGQLVTNGGLWLGSSHMTDLFSPNERFAFRLPYRFMSKQS